MARSKSKTLVVCDAGPIIHLDEVGCLPVMQDFAKALVSYGVRQEVLKHRQVSWEDPGVSWLVVSPRFPLEKPMQTMCQIFSLDAGEVEALSLLSKAPEAVFLTDDA